MPQPTSRVKTLLTLSGVFIFLAVLLVTMPTPATITFALFLPGLYCLWAAAVGVLRSGIIGCIPLLIGAIPAYAQGAMLYAGLLLSGMIMFAFLRRGKIGLAIVVSTAVLMSLFCAGILSYAQHAGIGIMQVMQVWVQQVMNQVAEVYTKILNPADMANFKTQRPYLEYTITRLLPAMTAMTFVFMIWINLLLVAKFDQRLDLKQWRTPDWVVALFIVSGVCTLVAYPLIQTVGYNMLILVSVSYFFQGLSIVAYYLGEYQWARLVRWVIYLLILSQFYIMMLVALCGLFDTWFYFRKRIQKEGENI